MVTTGPKRMIILSHDIPGVCIYGQKCKESNSWRWFFI